MAFDFPASPSIGSTYNIAGITYVWDGLAWNVQTGPSVKTAQTRNRIFNPAMQINQETAAAVTTGGYPVDQFVLSTSIATVTAVKQPASGPDALSSLATTITTGKPSLAAADYWVVAQPFEGAMVADFLWGTAKAKPVLARFWGYSNQAGTYALYLRNGAGNRYFLAPFTLPASAYKEIIIPIPGDITGTWPTDNTQGMIIGCGLAAGTTYGAGVAGWQSTAQFQIAGNTNLAQTANNAFYLANVGLYLDPDNTGVPPPFEMPDFGDELRRCQRYWEPMNITDLFLMTRLDGGQQMGAVWWFSAPKRVNPTMTFTNSGTGVSAYTAVVNGCEFLTGTMQVAAITSAKASARM
jgi:hypothetical protein